MPTLLGVDDAGRGPVIGPIVLAGVLIEDMDDGLLSQMGVKDSKTLTAKQRERLEKDIKKIAKGCHVVWRDAKAVDEAVKKNALNWLEADMTLEIIHVLKPDIVLLDCPSNNVDAYKSYVFERLKHKCEIRCEHKADAIYPTVAAGSILAKVERDRQIEAIKKELDFDFGSGYPADPLTVSFLKYHVEDPKVQPYLRTSWSSVKKLLEKKNQTTLEGF